MTEDIKDNIDQTDTAAEAEVEDQKPKRIIYNDVDILHHGVKLTEQALEKTRAHHFKPIQLNFSDLYFLNTLLVAGLQRTQLANDFHDSFMKRDEELDKKVDALACQIEDLNNPNLSTTVSDVIKLLGEIRSLTKTYIKQQKAQ